MRFLAAALALLLLGGCGNAMARFVQQGEFLHRAADDYVRMNVALRVWIRAECEASIERELAQLVEAGDEFAVRAFLTGAYPPLVTFDIIDKIDDGPTGILATPPSC